MRSIAAAVQAYTSVNGVAVADHGRESRAPVADRGRGREWVSIAFAACLALFPSGPSRSDTVFLKSGGTIPECRILRDEADTVHLRTPGGYMGVPKSEIARIEKGRSVFDELDERQKKLNPKDTKGHFDLAVWCLEKAGLRQEAETVLQKVIEIDANHAAARKLLRYHLDKESKEWKQLPALTIEVRVVAAKPIAEEIERTVLEQLDIVLRTRSDIVLGTGPSPSATSIDRCVLEVKVQAGQTDTARFYGQFIRGPATHAVLDWTPQTKWLPQSTVAARGLHFVGEIPGKQNSYSLPVVDAINRGHKQIHNFFDQLHAARLDATALRKAAPRKKA